MNTQHTLPFLSLLATTSLAQGAVITLTNANFNADTGAALTSVTGWTSVAGGGTNSAPSNYWSNTISPADLGAYSTIGLLKSDGNNFLAQGLTASDAGAVDATTFAQYTVNFDFGYRRDGGTNGDLTLRVALWNTTDNVELAGQDFTILNPGTGVNSLSARVATLTYDNTLTALTGDTLALRIIATSPDLAGNAWQRTAMVDNFSVTAVPEPATYGMIGAGALAAVSFVRRRRKRFDKSA